MDKKNKIILLISIIFIISIFAFIYIKSYKNTYARVFATQCPIGAGEIIARCYYSGYVSSLPWDKEIQLIICNSKEDCATEPLHIPKQNIIKIDTID